MKHLKSGTILKDKMGSSWEKHCAYANSKNKYETKWLLELKDVWASVSDVC